MIHFDDVDFSERRPEESDKFLLTLSVVYSGMSGCVQFHMYIHQTQSMKIWTMNDT